ncbi:MAG TPA: SurA N-terminal domain-containing protein [Salinisphaeraceae bacterium]|nr:SurA N-terminal domain-containing protein [Salinisphaeraceae bacterium]
MLQRIRDNASGPLAYAIVGLITLVFGVWGIGSYFTDAADPVVASVGNIDITKYELNQSYERRYQQLRQQLGENFDPADVNPAQLRRVILRTQIRNAVLDQYARTAGYRTTDAALLQTIQSDPNFQANGQFSGERYRALLANAGLSPSEYEKRLRHDLVSGQVRAGLIGSTFVAEPELAYVYGLQHQQRKVAYLTFPAEAYADAVELSDADIQDWYDEHGAAYTSPERVKLAYVVLDRNQLGSEAELDEEALRNLYEENKGRFSTPEQRDAWQLFLPVSADNSQNARQQIQALAQQLQQGKAFSDLAAEDAADYQVKQLESVSQRELPNQVGKALFALDVDEVSTPIRAADGWYLVMPTAIETGTTQAFATPEVQQELQQMAQERHRNARFAEMSDRMERLAVQAPNDLQTLAEELQLDIQQTDWMTRTQGERLGSNDAVRAAAFSDDVLEQGFNSSAIVLDDDRQVVLRVIEHQPPQQKPLAEVKDQIRADLTRAKALQLAQADASEAQEQLAAGAALADVAADGVAELHETGYIEQSANEVPTAVREAAFALPPPDEGKANYKVTQIGDDSAALVVLNDVKTAQTEDAVPPRFRQQLLGYNAQLEFAAFVNYLRNQAKVKVYQEQLDSE